MLPICVVISVVGNVSVLAQTISTWRKGVTLPRFLGTALINWGISPLKLGHRMIVVWLRPRETGFRANRLGALVLLGRPPLTHSSPANVGALNVARLF